MRFAILILFIACSNAFGQEAAFKFQLELSKAKAAKQLVREPLPMPKAERLEWGAAYSQSLKAGKPVLLRVGNFQCGETCEHCSGFLLSDIGSFFNDSTPRLILAYPSGGKLFKGHEWTSVPTVKEVEQVAARFSTCINCPKGKCDCCEGQCGGPNCVFTPARATFAPAANCASGR